VNSVRVDEQRGQDGNSDAGCGSDLRRPLRVLARRGPVCRRSPNAPTATATGPPSSCSRIFTVSPVDGHRLGDFVHLQRNCCFLLIDLAPPGGRGKGVVWDRDVRQSTRRNQKAVPKNSAASTMGITASSTPSRRGASPHRRTVVYRLRVSADQAAVAQRSVSAVSGSASGSREGVRASSC
jgi:hypothetical protein